MVDRAARGEPITITKAGRPVAELHPLAAPGLSADALLRRWRHLPTIDPARFRADVDEIIEPSL